MAIKSILTRQEDFTGEFPVTSRTSALWRFNERTPNENLQLMDSSGHGRHFTISGWSGTSANLIAGRFGRYFRQNIVNPTSEKTHLIAENDGTFCKRSIIRYIDKKTGAAFRLLWFLYD